MAVVYVLGVCVSAGECGFVLRGAAGILFACLVFHGIKKKTLRKGALALLFVLLLAGGLRYQLSARAFQRSEERIRIFSGMKVCLRGEVQEYTEAAGKAKLRVRNALLSSAYGARDALPASATAAMRARYDQPVGTILVYLEAEDSLHARRPLPGEQIEVYGKISPANAARNEGQFDFRLYYRTISVHGSMYGTSFRIIGGDPKPFARGLQALRLQMGTILDRLLPPQDAPEDMRRYLTEDGQGNGVFHLTKAVSLTARDVRNLQLAKAAVAGGIRVLLEQRGVTADDIASVELAGGFGNYLSPESAVRIGMLPRACLSKIRPLGNAALAGASMLALDGENWRKLAEIPEKCRYLELSGRDDFSRAFTDSLTF